MERVKICPICRSDEFEALGSLIFSAEKSKAQSEYLKKRWRVLSQEWVPNVDEVKLRYEVCRECGFVFYTPRPDDGDIARKYRRLEDIGQDYGVMESSEVLKQRSDLLFRRIGLPASKGSRVLDFGGGGWPAYVSLSE